MSKLEELSLLNLLSDLQLFMREYQINPEDNDEELYIAFEKVMQYIEWNYNMEN